MTGSAEVSLGTATRRRAVEVRVEQGGARGAAWGSGMAQDRLIITIDGPAKAGKSSVAKALAERLGLEMLNTGAMYRAATALAIEAGVRLDDGAAIVRLVTGSGMRFDFARTPPVLYCGGRDMSAVIESAAVREHVSAVSSLPELRAVLVEMQRDVARAHPRLVAEGRDQGSVVFSDATVKFYLHARARVRAERNARQMFESPTEAQVAELEKELIARDAADRAKPVGALVVPAGAVEIDSSEKDLEGTIEAMMGYVGSGGKLKSAKQQSSK